MTDKTNIEKAREILADPNRNTLYVDSVEILRAAFAELQKRPERISVEECAKRIARLQWGDRFEGSWADEGARCLAIETTRNILDVEFSKCVTWWESFSFALRDFVEPEGK